MYTRYRRNNKKYKCAISLRRYNMIIADLNSDFHLIEILIWCPEQDNKKLVVSYKLE